eukprot:1138466-Pelagomonas_calceolata.AAC.1
MKNTNIIDQLSIGRHQQDASKEANAFAQQQNWYKSKNLLSRHDGVRGYTTNATSAFLVHFSWGSKEDGTGRVEEHHNAEYGPYGNC